MSFIRRPNPFWKGFLLGAITAILGGTFLSKQVAHISEQDYEQLKLVDLDGKKVSLTAFDTRPLVINYWATWCKPCIQEFPDFEKARKKYGNKVSIIMISDDSRLKVIKLLKSKGYGMNFYISESKLNLNVRPVTYFYKKNRQDFFKQVGAMDSTFLYEKISKQLTQD